MANIQAQNVKTIKITQGSVDWKCRRGFSFTSASSYDVLKPCMNKLWHLYENKPHWRAVRAYLDGSYTMERDKNDEEQDDGVQQNQYSDNECDEDFIPESMKQQVSYDIYCLNSDQLIVNEVKTSPFYVRNEYLEAFKKHVTRKFDASCEKKNSDSNALKKAVDQWLDETNKERRKYFFLKVDGLQKAMTIKYSVNWKCERFPQGAKNSRGRIVGSPRNGNFHRKP
jgi:hypothetical protein